MNANTINMTVTIFNADSEMWEQGVHKLQYEQFKIATHLQEYQHILPNFLRLNARLCSICRPEATTTITCGEVEGTTNIHYLSALYS